jgi:hypothetical protein
MLHTFDVINIYFPDFEAEGFEHKVVILEVNMGRLDLNNEQYTYKKEQQRDGNDYAEGNDT